MLSSDVIRAKYLASTATSALGGPGRLKWSKWTEEGQEKDCLLLLETTLNIVNILLHFPVLSPFQLKSSNISTIGHAL